MNTGKESKARAVLNSCIVAIGRPPMESLLSENHRGGYMCELEFQHYEELSWSEVVTEVISFGQTLGVGWVLYGDISEECSAVLSKQGSSKIKITGLEWASLTVLNERSA